MLNKKLFGTDLSQFPLQLALNYVILLEIFHGPHTSI